MHGEVGIQSFIWENGKEFARGGGEQNRRWEDNVKIHLKSKYIEGVD